MHEDREHCHNHDGDGEKDDEEEDDDDDDEDATIRFQNGYLRHWWTESSRLPTSVRPSFCLRHSFKDPFITFEERALPQILLSSSKKNPNPSSTSASKIMTAKDASTLVETTHGELTRILFYGNPQEIKHSPCVWQTSYGRRSTTMASLATSHPTVFDPTVLHAYVDAKFKHISNVISCKEQGILVTVRPRHYQQHTFQRIQTIALRGLR